MVWEKHGTCPDVNLATIELVAIWVDLPISGSLGPLETKKDRLQQTGGSSTAIRQIGRAPARKYPTRLISFEYDSTEYINKQPTKAATPLVLTVPQPPGLGKHFCRSTLHELGMRQRNRTRPVAGAHSNRPKWATGCGPPNAYRALPRGGTTNALPAGSEVVPSAPPDFA